MVMVAVRGVCVCGWVGGGGVVLGGLELIFFVLEGGSVEVFAR